MKRDSEFDKFITNFFDNLWNSNAYLDSMGKTLEASFEVKKQWNKNMETFLDLFQLPNQKLQQKTLHTLNTLLTEWRFENEELKLKVEKLEKEVASLKEAKAVE